MSQRNDGIGGTNAATAQDRPDANANNTCSTCRGYMSSLLTRRIGDIAVCVTCGDKILPLMNAIADGVVNRIRQNLHDGMSIDECVRTELKHFEPWITDSQSDIVRASIS